MSATIRPLPVVTDPDTGGFFEAAAREELAVRQCEDCGTVLHLPRARCRACGSWSTRWRVVGGRARVVSWTVVEHQVHPAFPAPYAVVLVELDDVEGVRLVGHLPGRPTLGAGVPVQVTFERLEADTALPQWRLLPEPTGTGAKS